VTKPPATKLPAAGAVAAVHKAADLPLANKPKKHGPSASRKPARLASAPAEIPGEHHNLRVLNPSAPLVMTLERPLRSGSRNSRKCANEAGNNQVVPKALSGGSKTVPSRMQTTVARANLTGPRPQANSVVVRLVTASPVRPI